MKLIILVLLLIVTNSADSAERKVDENGNEYFISSEDEIESTNSITPGPYQYRQALEMQPAIQYQSIALQMKTGCMEVEDVGQPGSATVAYKKYMIIIPTNPEGLPPHPGENGKLTIHGIDSDGDCVRDDIEHVVFNRFNEENQNQLRKYLFEYAIWLDFFLIDGLSQDSARTADREMTRIGTCIEDILGADETVSETQYLFSQFHNTFERSHRYIDNSQLVSGWTQKDLLNVTCT